MKVKKLMMKRKKKTSGRSASGVLKFEHWSRVLQRSNSGKYIPNEQIWLEQI